MTDPASLPAYIDRLGHGEICYPQPLKLTNTMSYAFGLEADRDAVQALVDSQLNAACAPALRYQAFAGNVLLTILEVESATSTEQVIGLLGDREAAIWVPLLEWREGHKLPRLTFWVPYLLINVDSGMVVGREIWGYRKSMGEISLPEAEDDPAEFIARTTVFPVFSETQRGERRELIRVTKEGSRGRLADEFHNIEGFLNAVWQTFAHHDGFWKDTLENIALAREFGEMLLDPVVPVVNLKQFRATEDATKACYQAVTESPCHLDRIRGGGFIRGDWTCALLSCASHRIVEDCGLAGTVNGDYTEVPVKYAFWVNFDFTTRNGITLWQAGA